jgi:hypothetical protein
MFEKFTSPQTHLNSNKACLVCSNPKALLLFEKNKEFESYDESFIIFGLFITYFIECFEHNCILFALILTKVVWKF